MNGEYSLNIKCGLPYNSSQLLNLIQTIRYVSPRVVSTVEVYLSGQPA